LGLKNSFHSGILKSQNLTTTHKNNGCTTTPRYKKTLLQAYAAV